MRRHRTALTRVKVASLRPSDIARQRRERSNKGRKVATMAWKTITTQLSNPERADILLSVAGRLAERFAAHLIGLDATPSFTFAGPMATPADVDAIVAADRARTTQLRTIFDTA
jgi:hypothetical protein